MSVTCEYCGTTSQVIRERSSGHPAAAWTSTPSVTPEVRPGLLTTLVIILIVLAGGALVAGVEAMTTTTASAATVSDVPAPRAPVVEPLASEPEWSAPPEPPIEPASAEDSAASDESAERPTAPPKSAPKIRRKRKPNPYEIAKIIRSSYGHCIPRDIQAPGHPLWYTPTITMTVKGDGFTDVQVSVGLSNTDPSKLWFDEDRKRAVTQEHLDERRKKVQQCISRAVRGVTIPAGHQQSGTQGKLRFTLSRDGVPYGVRNL